MAWQTQRMGRAAVNGIEIEYETFGDIDDPPLLLVNGFTSQLTGWDTEMCEQFAAAGRFVIRYDNRDVGLSTHFDGVSPNLSGVMKARKEKSAMPEVPYTLTDFAADGMALLTALGIEKAHIAGVSMGGMIVQTMAIDHARRVLSLTSIMSHTGEPAYGRSTKEANEALMKAPPTDRQRFIDETAEGRRVYSSPKYYSLDWEKERCARDYDRMFYPEGASRQMAAIMASPDRADGLRNLTVPTLVVHGRADTLITLSGGERTAELVPGSVLLVLNDMGHDLPPALWPTIVDAMISFQRHAVSAADRP
jgi:pimeloyl-ACP methyl ester carboxylesterase